MKFAIDWDDTLVDVHTQEWLPGALDTLRQLARGADVIIHTCRANWPEGLASVEAKLASEGLKLEIVGKPYADLYIDDKAEKPRWTGLGDADVMRKVGVMALPRHPGVRAVPGSGLPRRANGIVVY